MSKKLVDLGVIKAMRNVDGTLLPESFCSECDHILIPHPHYISNDPNLCEYICPNCGSKVDKMQIDSARRNFKK